VVEPSKLLVINARTFEQMVKGNAEIAIRLIKKLALRLDSANELIEVLLHRDPKARVILGLARQVELIGEEREGGAVFVAMEREELAGEVGVSVSESNEVLQRLRRLHIAEESVDELGRLGFLVHDVRRLREFLEFLEMREKFGDG
jgi:CRP-like cAMP-binding protein